MRRLLVIASVVLILVTGCTAPPALLTPGASPSRARHRRAGAGFQRRAFRGGDAGCTRYDGPRGRAYHT